MTASWHNHQEVFECDVFFDDDIVDGKRQKIEYTDNCNTTFGVQCTCIFSYIQPDRKCNRFRDNDLCFVHVKANHIVCKQFFGKSIENT